MCETQIHEGISFYVDYDRLQITQVTSPVRPVGYNIGQTRTPKQQHHLVELFLW